MIQLPKNPAAVALGRLGGKAGTGKAKARKVSSEQARAAVKIRWAKHRAEALADRAAVEWDAAQSGPQ